MRPRALRVVPVLGCAVVGALTATATAAKSHTSITWVTVAYPGNPPDTRVMNDGSTGYGGVSYVYQIARTEVTNAQYAEMLNAVAKIDPLGLYDPQMDGSLNNGLGSGLVRTGVPGSYSYAPAPGRADVPVNYVSVYDAMRFANWVQNGKGNADTETGAYTLLGGTPIPTNGNTVMRNRSAKVFLPTENEWYKAAYYSPAVNRYYLYPTGTNNVPTCAPPGPKPNTAACNNTAPNRYTPVGSYTRSPSPYGTFDQGGNIHEWTETLSPNAPVGPNVTVPAPGAEYRNLRGGDGVDPVRLLAATNRSSDVSASEFSAQGFRLAAATARRSATSAKRHRPIANGWPTARATSDGRLALTGRDAGAAAVGLLLLSLATVSRRVGGRRTRE